MISPEDQFDDDPPLWCKRRNSQCNDELCADYGCALEAGMTPDRDETYISDDELIPRIPVIRAPREAKEN